MKGKRGVSAITLTVTIVMIILLAGFSLFFSRDTVVEGNVARIYAEIQEVTDAVKALSLDSLYVTDALSGFEVTSFDNINARVGNNLIDGKQYYYLGFGDDTVSEVMKQTMNEKLGVRSVENSYVVAVNDIGDVEVYLVDGININDEYHYTYEDIYAEYVNVTQK